MQSTFTKISYQEISSIGRNLLEFFCITLYIEFMSDLHEKSKVALHTMQCRIPNLKFLWLFLSYANNKFTGAYTHTQTNR